MDDLFANSWQRAWSGIGATRDDALRDAVLAAYAQPQRHYHSRQHLGECLQWFEQVQALARRPHEIELALWFHDAIYEPKAGDNEARSADWAVRALTAAGVAAEAVQRVHGLVMATLHSAVPVDDDERLLVDIDLAILGAGRERFDEYEQQIRREYAFVPGWLFKRKRRAILQGFLQREHLFGSDYFRQRLEQAARDNLRRAVG